MEQTYWGVSKEGASLKEKKKGLLDSAKNPVLRKIRVTGEHVGRNEDNQTSGLPGKPSLLYFSLSFLK